MTDHKPPSPAYPVQVDLTGKTALITGGAKRIGAIVTSALADFGVNVVIHHSKSSQEAEKLAAACVAKGVQADILPCDFASPADVENTARSYFSAHNIDFLINNAAIFENLSLKDTDLVRWNAHININLTAPFLFSKYFGSQRSIQKPGRIINFVDWRALHPGADHFPYTVSKAALASMTKSLAVSFAPHTQVNAIAFGAILPPSDGSPAEKFLLHVPSGRTARVDEVIQTVLFLLSGPEYITGEIIHLDGGRHLY